MKNKIIRVLLFSVIVCLSTLFLPPNVGDEADYYITDVAVQDNTTYLEIKTTYSAQEYIKEPIDKKYNVGWTTANVNVRNEPSIHSEILEIYKFNTQVEYYKYDDDWVIIKHSSGEAYINMDYISESECDYTDHEAPITSGFKSYMPYTAITSQSSKQYQLQTIAYTGNYGIRMADNCYCVAIGTGFNADVGTYFDIILENGSILQCVVGDIKADEHTDKSNEVTVANDCLTEFIVDNGSLDRNAKRMGDISYCCDEWNSRVKKIRVYNKNIFD